jgi:glycerophosphoryl diester phosphodiesterase
MVAFRKAMESGAEGVEFDVRLSKDGVPVVIHDATLSRTVGINERVAHLTANQLSQLDAGSWFNVSHAAKAQGEFASEGVPPLASVLGLLESLPGPVYVELKCETEDEVAPLVDAVCSVVGASELQEKIIIGSFRLGVLPSVRTILPGVQTAALFAPKIMRLLRKEKYLIDIAREFGADHLSVHKSLVSRKLVRKAEKHGMPVTVWTVNASRWVPRAAKQRIYAVITNDPSTLLARRRSMPRSQTPGETLVDRPFPVGSPRAEE